MVTRVLLSLFLTTFLFALNCWGATTPQQSDRTLLVYSGRDNEVIGLDRVSHGKFVFVKCSYSDSFPEKRQRVADPCTPLSPALDAAQLECFVKEIIVKANARVRNAFSMPFIAAFGVGTGVGLNEYVELLFWNYHKTPVPQELHTPKTWLTLVATAVDVAIIFYLNWDSNRMRMYEAVLGAFNSIDRNQKPKRVDFTAKNWQNVQGFLRKSMERTTCGLR